MNIERSLDAFLKRATSKALPIDLAAPELTIELQTAIDALISGARVVGVGESQHYVGEFSRFRSLLFKYLVKKHHFTTFVFECDVIESKAAHDYVLGLHDRADDAYESLGGLWGMWYEMQDLLRWMRDYNLANKGARPLRFYGMDGSQSWGCAGNTLAFACDYLNSVDPSYAAQTRETLLPLAEAIMLESLDEHSEDRVGKLVRGLSSVVARLQIDQVQYIERSGVEAFDWAYRSAALALQIGTLLGEIHRDPANQARIWWNYRDSCMALQLRWIIDHEGQNAGVVVGAHNIHLQKGYARETDFDQTTMGQHLVFGPLAQKIIMISGTNGYSLRPGDKAAGGSFQAALGKVGLCSFLLDLRAVGTNDPAAAAWLNEEWNDRTNTMYQPLRPGQAWDAAYYSDRISLDRLRLPDRLKRPPVVLKPGRLDGLVGVYDIVGVVGSKVVLRCIKEGDNLITTGTESDGELFPMHRSTLFPVSDSEFRWKEWPLEIVFNRDANGSAKDLLLRTPDHTKSFRGTKR
jgi:erythromycin esterase-like protein